MKIYVCLMLQMNKLLFFIYLYMAVFRVFEISVYIKKKKTMYVYMFYERQKNKLEILFLMVSVEIIAFIFNV